MNSHYIYFVFDPVFRLIYSYIQNPEGDPWACGSICLIIQWLKMNYLTDLKTMSEGPILFHDPARKSRQSPYALSRISFFEPLISGESLLHLSRQGYEHRHFQLNRLNHLPTFMSHRMNNTFADAHFPTQGTDYNHFSFLSVYYLYQKQEILLSWF